MPSYRLTLKSETRLRRKAMTTVGNLIGRSFSSRLTTWLRDATIYMKLLKFWNNFISFWVQNLKVTQIKLDIMRSQNDIVDHLATIQYISIYFNIYSFIIITYG